MGRISTGVGLISGINSRDIIDQLISLESRPKTLLQSRIDGITQQRIAYTDLQTKLSSLRLFATGFKKPSTFQAASTTTSNADVITATAANGASVGSFQFQVARLVTTQQSISRGYADFDSAKIGAGTVTIEMGGGELTSQTPLNNLRGGEGVRRGQFRITDRSGNNAVIDTTAAVNLEDVVKKINTNLDISVRAKIENDQLVLTDTTGAAVNNFVVQDLGDSQTALDLGIVANVASGTVTGTDINYVGLKTSLAQLNDGRGVRTAASGNDFSITTGAGTFQVGLASARTIEDTVNAINNATGNAGAVRAEVVSGSNGIRLTRVGGGSITVAELSDSKAATDLGIVGTGTGTIEGKEVLAEIGTTLLSSLRGGAGLTLGTLSIQSRTAGAATDIDLSSARTVQDVLDTINTAALGVTASLNPSGNGIALKDTTGGAGNLVVGGAAGTDLGLTGSYAQSVSVVKGANLQKQWFSENTLLADINGGKGVARGRFTITSASGQEATIDLSQGNETNIKDVLAEINSRGIGVVASINANGDGLMLTDTSGGAGKMKVVDVDATTAKDLNILGTATTTTINGTWEKTIDVTATDALTTLQKKITDLGFGVQAQIINDGSALAPYRLSINARNSGRDGRIVFDGGATTLDPNTLVEAQDAAVFMGASGAGQQPLLVTSSSNQVGGVIRGVTLELNGVSDRPVTLNISRNAEAVTKQVTDFVEGFNTLKDKINELTRYDNETNRRGLLMGESAVSQIENEMYAMVNAVVSTGGRYRILADVGVKIGAGAKLEFNEDKFRAAYADDPLGVESLFTTPAAGLGETTLLTSLNSGTGVRTAAGGLDDFRVTTKDGTTFAINLANTSTLGDMFTQITTRSGGKVTASFNPNTKGIRLVDNSTTGTGTFNLASLNGSLALTDLGLTPIQRTGAITGQDIPMPFASSFTGGFGYIMEARLNRLIDPVLGVIPQQNTTLDNRTTEFQSRISSLDKLIGAKRERLERQFSQMESTLATLQSQQSSLGQIQNISFQSRSR